MADRIERDVIAYTEALLDGSLDRRAFLERLLALGVSAGFATSLLESLAPLEVLAAPAEKPKRGGILHIGYPDEVPALDPHTSPSESSFRFFYLVYSTLLKLDKNLKPAGDLAESWHVSHRGLEYTFKLRPNLRFSNGEPLTSKDVKASFERILDPKTVAIARTYFTNIASISTPNAHTVVFHLSQPNAALPVYLASPNAAILPKRLLNAKADFNKIANAIGSGPFKVDKWLPDNYMTLSRNKHFYEPGKPYVDGVKVSIIPNSDSLLAALRRGTVDFTYTLDAVLGKEAAAVHNLRVQRTPDLSYYLLFIQTAHEPFTKKEVRQAISYALDRHAIIQAANLGEGIPVGPLGGNTRYGLPASKLPGYKHDPAKARKMLAKAGLPNGFKVTMLTQTSDPDNAPTIAQIVQSQLKDVGITINIDLMEFSAWVQHWLKATFDIIPGNNGGSPDPDGYLARYFFSDGNLNFVTGHWHSAEMDKLLTQGRATTNFKKRKAIYDKAQTLLVEASPFIWLYSGFLYSLTQPRVQGFIPRANHSLIGLRDVWLK